MFHTTLHSRGILDHKDNIRNEVYCIETLRVETNFLEKNKSYQIIFPLHKNKTFS